MPICRVLCATAQNVTWKDGAGCGYTDELAVFRFRMISDTDGSSFGDKILQPDEQQRAQRYFRDEDRQRFVYGRSLLRIVCGQYTNQPPQTVRFVPGAHGKPDLQGDSGWHVNVSHSGDWILLAVGRMKVGVDVEKITPQFAFEDMLINSFSQEEQAYCSASTLR